MPILLWTADWLQDHFANIFRQTPNLFIGNGSYNEAYSATGKIHLRQQEENQKENAI